ncbi:Gfo/Idh/MocA family protein [Paenibacillus sp. GCM10027626]|uniref:Gfo/Idh/MocA family protein n=1 Tax=Paenibacillus sp. GCM10027626 TaxID=3273411 RepID=UPI003626889A
MSDPVRIGLIGASWFADLWFLPVLSKHPKVEVAAICSKNGANAAAMAAKYGIPAVYASASEMMEQAGLDGVCIITPNDTHFPLVMEALSHNLHVLCEKPLAMNSEQSREMVAEAKRKGVIHAVNFTVREHPGIQYLREAVAAGRIGRLLEGRFEYTGDYALGGSAGWRGSVQQAGAGGILQDLGSHLIDMAHYVTGERIMAVQGSLRCTEAGGIVNFAERSAQDQAADSAFFIADFQSGAHASFHTSWVRAQGAGGQTFSVELFGTEGGVKFATEGYGYKLYDCCTGKRWQPISLPDADGWDLTAEPSEDRFRPYRETDKNEVWKWAEAICNKKVEKTANLTNIPTFDDGDRAQRVIDAVLAAAAVNKKVNIFYD